MECPFGGMLLAGCPFGKMLWRNALFQLRGLKFWREKKCRHSHLESALGGPSPRAMRPRSPMAEQQEVAVVVPGPGTSLTFGPEEAVKHDRLICRWTVHYTSMGSSAPLQHSLKCILWHNSVGFQDICTFLPLQHFKRL